MAIMKIDELRQQISFMTVKDIKELVFNFGYSEEIAELLCSDSRLGVRKTGVSIKKILQRQRDEKLKYHKMSYYEELEMKKGYKLIAGIDEVGIGPLAGPVVAAAVILDPERPVYGVDDSKKLSEKKRLELNQILTEKAVSFAIGIAEPDEIDRINILQASFMAMKRAVSTLSVKADSLLIDARKLEGVNIPQQAIIRGDSKSVSIAAASIIAKTYRDRLMVNYSKKYPQYGFERHKGYPSEQHRNAIRQYGPCVIHRNSFTLV